MIDCIESVEAKRLDAMISAIKRAAEYAAVERFDWDATYRQRAFIAHLAGGIGGENPELAKKLMALLRGEA